MAGTPSPVNYNPNGPSNFSPYGTIEVAATNTSSSKAFTSTLSKNASSVLVFNETTHTVYIAFGSSAGGNTVTVVQPTATESLNSIPVGAGAILTFVKGPGNDTVAVIAPSGDGNVYFTAGEGA